MRREVHYKDKNPVLTILRPHKSKVTSACEKFVSKTYFSQFERQYIQDKCSIGVPTVIPNIIILFIFYAPVIGDSGTFSFCSVCPQKL